MPTNAIRIDTNRQNELFEFITTEGSTPSLRVYVYSDGTAIVLDSANTAKFIYAVGRDSSEMVEITGTINTGTNYIDFDFTVAKTAINGRFFASIILYDDSINEIVVQSDGLIILRKNPALDSAAILDTTITINWGLYTNLPPYPWAIGNDVTVFTDCSESPYPVIVGQAATTFVHNADCDFIYELPKALPQNIGKMYGFINMKKAYTVTLQVQEGDTIDDSPVTGIKFTIRNYAIPSSIMIRQVTANQYVTVFGDGAWATAAGEVSLSSSSSEEYSSSSSSSSSSIDSSSSSSS